MRRLSSSAVLSGLLVAFLSLRCGAPVVAPDGGAGGGAPATGGGTAMSGGGAGGGGGSTGDAGPDASVELDAGADDAGADDAGSMTADAGFDGGTADAGAVDGGASDAGLNDAGAVDSGFDPGPIDAGELGVIVSVPDGGTLSTGIIDLVVVGDRVVTLSNLRYGTRNIATLTRFLADGRVDPSFGTGGFSVLDPGQTVNGNRLMVDANGRLVVGGLFVTGASATSFGAIRTDANGALDPAFGTGGFATHSFGSASEVCAAMTVTSTGDVLVGGSYGVAGSPGPDQWAITRFTSSGQLDTSFGNAGEVLIEIRAPGANGVGDIDELHALSNGTFLASGRFVNFDANAGSHLGLLARFNANGTFDSTFGTAGRVDLVSTEGASTTRSLVVQSTGRIIQWVTQLGLMGFTAQGALDSTWGTSGTATLGRVPSTLAVGPGDLVYALGTGPNSTTGRPAYLQRRLANGAADTVFGVKTFGLDRLGQTGDVAPSAMGFMPDGRIVIGGQATPTGGAPALFLAFIEP